MNSSIIIGRLTAQPELKTTPNGVSVCSFSVAVERKIKGADGKAIVDFIDCVAWRNTAEFLCKWFNKGVRIAIKGELQTRFYKDKDGKQHKVYEILVDELDFADGKQAQNDVQASTGFETKADAGGTDFDGFTPIEDGDTLPF